MSYERPSILIVDNDADNCDLLPLLLQKDGDRYNITTCNTFSAAKLLVASRRFDLFITEYFIPDDQTVSKFCRSLRQAQPTVPVIIYSVFHEKLAKEDAMAAGADLYLVKPNDIDRICTSVREFIDRGTRPIQAHQHSVPRRSATTIF